MYIYIYILCIILYNTYMLADHEQIALMSSF